jgi:hypothetical protein
MSLVLDGQSNYIDDENYLVRIPSILIFPLTRNTKAQYLGRPGATNGRLHHEIQSSSRTAQQDSPDMRTRIFERQIRVLYLVGGD